MAVPKKKKSYSLSKKKRSAHLKMFVTKTIKRNFDWEWDMWEYASDHNPAKDFIRKTHY